MIHHIHPVQRWKTLPRRDCFLARPPTQGRGQVKEAVSGPDRTEVVGLGPIWQQCLDIGTAVRCRQQLNKARIRRSVHSNLAIAPRLFAYPLLGIVTISALINVWAPLTLGRVQSARVHHDNYITVLCVIPCAIHTPVLVVLLVIGCADEQHRKWTRLARRIDVGGQLNVVTHRHHHVVPDLHCQWRRCTGPVTEL